VRRVQGHVRYFPISNEPERENRWRERLADHGFDVASEYDPETLIVTLGGDGTVLYAARTREDPTILPVRAGDSQGNRAQFDADSLVGELERLERGDASLQTTTFQTRTAFQGGAFPLAAVVVDRLHLVGVFVVVGQCPVDVRRPQVVLFGDRLGGDSSVLDPLGDLTDGDPTTLDARLTTHHVVVPHDPGRALTHSWCWAVTTEKRWHDRSYGLASVGTESVARHRTCRIDCFHAMKTVRGALPEPREAGP
jgi:hypothetical protein